MERPAIATARTEARCLEAAGDLPAALDAYGRALAETPDDAALLSELARVATRLEMPQAAEALHRRSLSLDPSRLEAVDGLARALRDQHRHGEAVEVLRDALAAHPQDARLWNALGVVLHHQGDSRHALTFFAEALRLDPCLAVARYNRGGAAMDLGELAAAQADFDAALAATDVAAADRAMIAFARATVLLARGEVGAGWDAYEARLSPDLPAPTVFDAPGRCWTPGDALSGAGLLVIGEQGLGDELMFANVIADVLDALGPAGWMHLAVEPRLVPLFARSFPAAEVTAHATRRETARAVRSVPGASACELWAPMASLLRRFRRKVAAFPASGGYLRPDPGRTAHWRSWLDAAAPGLRRIGLTWRSGKLTGERRRQYPALADWTPLLRTPGVAFVNLQYGECEAELAGLERQADVDILRPPGIDLKADIDDLAALCVALDEVVAVPNATAALAGACGAGATFIAAPAAWPRLGTAAYPWYPQARSFVAPRLDGWAQALAEAAEALRAR